MITVPDISSQGLPTTDAVDRLKRKARFAFHLAVGLFVVFSSFFYGLSYGLKNQSGQAHAFYSPGMAHSVDAVSAADAWPAKYPLVAGIVLVSMGENIAVNGRDAEVVTFFSTRAVKGLLEEQSAIWKAAGFKTVGAARARRGTMVGIDAGGVTRLTISAWEVPPTLRRKVSRGYPVQGVLAVGGIVSSLQADTAEEQGQIPGVPVMAGGRSGAVLSADDVGGRSVTGVYTNPDDVETNILFYVDAMTHAGWELRGPYSDPSQIEDLRTLTFSNRAQEAILLFAEAPNPLTSEAKTVVTVIVKPERRVSAG